MQAMQRYFMLLLMKIMLLWVEFGKQLFRNKNNSLASDSAFLWMAGGDFCSACCLSLISHLASLLPVWEASMCHCVTGGGWHDGAQFALPRTHSHSFTSFMFSSRIDNLFPSGCENIFFTGDLVSWHFLIPSSCRKQHQDDDLIGKIRRNLFL